MNNDEVRFAAALLQARRLSQQPGTSIDSVKAAYLRAFAFAPDNTEAHAALSDYLNKNGRSVDAIFLLRPLFDQDKLGYDAVLSLGNCYSTLRDFPAAKMCYSRAVALRPEVGQARNNLGYVLTELHEFEAALEHLTEAVILQPGMRLAQSNLIELLARQNRWSDALPFCKVFHAAEHSDRSYFLLGRAHQETGQLAEARALWTECLEKFPDYTPASTFLGGMCYRNGDIARATELFRSSAQGNPSNTTAVSNYLLMLNYQAHDPAYIYSEHVAWTRGWHTGTADAVAKPKLALGKRKLRVGYVSPDFYQHPVGQIIAPVLMQHDRKQFDIVLYNAGDKSDGLTEQLKQHFGDRWRELGRSSNKELAAQIVADKVDVLIDLSGHTGDSRLPIFGQRLAPVQMTYLGYPNTTGLSTMDYRISDAIADPPELADAIHSEKLLRMPAPFLCIRKPPELPPCGPTPLLRNGYLTLASFNNLAKLSDETLALWSRIMQEMPETRLIVKAAPLSDAVLKTEQLQRFERMGFDLGRVQMHARMGFAQHLALYQQADIALDPYPYHGTATTIEALWMGIPVITLAGKTHVSRVSLSLLTSLALTELVAHSTDEYVARCKHYASHPQELEALRQGMRQRLEDSPATNPAESARKLEALFRSLA
ncbi:MAG: tetratricopeptide repeat protein [Pseudomonadota bacterium]